MTSLNKWFCHVLVLAHWGCGSTTIDLSQSLVISMLGSFVAPDGAAGNAEPKSQTYTLQDIQLTRSTGEVEDLYTDPEAEFKIVNRSQILHEGDLSGLEDVAFSSVTVTFAAAIKGGGKIEDEMAITLSDGVIVHTEDFSVAKAQAKRLIIKVNWKNTILRDDDAGTETMSEPTFSTVLEDE